MALPVNYHSVWLLSSQIPKTFRIHLVFALIRRNALSATYPFLLSFPRWISDKWRRTHSHSRICKVLRCCSLDHFGTVLVSPTLWIEHEAILFKSADRKDLELYLLLPLPLMFSLSYASALPLFFRACSEIFTYFNEVSLLLVEFALLLSTLLLMKLVVGR